MDNYLFYWKTMKLRVHDKSVHSYRYQTNISALLCLNCLNCKINDNQLFKPYFLICYCLRFKNKSSSATQNLSHNSKNLILYACFCVSSMHDKIPKSLHFSKILPQQFILSIQHQFRQKLQHKILELASALSFLLQVLVSLQKFSMHFHFEHIRLTH